MKKKKPEFIRQKYEKKRLRLRWKKPKGIHSKLRLQKRGRGCLVRVGYRSPSEARNLSKAGLKIIKVYSLKQLNGIKKGECVAKLGNFIGGENGGWSRHLHYQVLVDLPPQRTAPIGYSTKSDLPDNKNRFPDPKDILGISY